MHSRRPSRPARLAWLAAIALAIGACSTSAAGPSTPSGLPDGIPIPADAAVVVGPGGGYDAGATLYGFSSDLGPAAALHGYAAQLVAAGFARAGTNGPWELYRHGATLVAVRAGGSGPPTDLLVRITTLPATASPAGASAQAGGSSGHSGGSSAGAGSSKANGNPNPGANGNASGNRNPNPGANGNASGNGLPAATPAPNGAAGATAAPNGNAFGAGNGNPDPGANGNAGGNGNPDPGANGNAGGNGLPAATPVPQPDPPHGQPVVPPGQAGRTPSPGSAQTPNP